MMMGEGSEWWSESKKSMISCSGGSKQMNRLCDLIESAITKRTWLHLLINISKKTLKSDGSNGGTNGGTMINTDP